jgi:N-acetylglutamate synthase-like GNAT family acetyltransferase
MIACLVERMSQEKHLLPQKAEDLIFQLHNDRSVVAIEDGQIVGHATLWPIAENWYETGSTFVCPTNRDKKINITMYHILLAHHQEKNILATTTNAISLHIGKKLGFVTIKRNSLPQEALVGTCVCSHKKTGSDNALASCQLAWSGDTWNPLNGWTLPCHVRVVPDTFKRHSGMVRIQNFEAEKVSV